MEFISGKHLSRRTFMRGVGASVALPFLDAMVPAGRHWRETADLIDQTRFIAIEEVHGLAGCNEVWGAGQFLFAPEKVGRDWEFVEQNALKPVEAWRKYLTIISNTDCRMAEAYAAPEIGGDHFRSSATFLTQAHPKQTQGSDLFVGISMDQMHAQRYGQATPRPSMQFCIENLDQAGGCTYNYSCAYTDSISWASPTEPLPMVRDPRVAFDMLFGVGGTPEARAERRQANKSILDWIAGEISQVQRMLGAADRQRMERYMENIREVERRIEKVEAQNTSGEQRELPEAPPGVPDSFREHMELMFDVQALALESDMTRIITFKTGRDSQNTVFPESGSDKPFHPQSHHGNRPEAILEFNKISTYRISMLPYFLKRLESTMEGDKNLLEKSVILWGSPMSDANIHNHRRCPMFLLGHMNGQLEGNLHLKAPDGTPMANVMLALMHKLGHDDMEVFGDSNGVFSLDFPRAAAAATSSSSSR